MSRYNPREADRDQVLGTWSGFLGRAESCEKILSRSVVSLDLSVVHVNDWNC